jgi:uncharacterized protein
MPSFQSKKMSAICICFAILLGLGQETTAANSAEHSRKVNAGSKAFNAAAFSAYEKGDTQGAYRNYTQAAKLGEPSAMYNVAVMRINDEVNRPSLTQAHRTLKRSAELGFAPAQFMLATVLESAGSVSSKKPLSKLKAITDAVSWFEKAAQQGHPDASLALGTAYFLGRGTKLDYAQALLWYTKAAEFGDVAAQYLVASMHESATGTSKNLDTALMWYIAAARQGDVAAREKSKYLNEIISKEKQS